MNKTITFIAIAVSTAIGLAVVDAYNRGKKIQKDKNTMKMVKDFTENFKAADIMKDFALHAQNRALLTANYGQAKAKYESVGGNNPVIEEHLAAAQRMMDEYKATDRIEYAVAAEEQILLAHQLSVA